MTDKQLKDLCGFYVRESLYLDRIFRRTKNKRIRLKLFNRMMKLKNKYDWTYDEMHKQNIQY